VNSGEEHGRASVAQGGRRGDQTRGGGVRVGFIGDSAAQLMGERGRERERSRAELKTAGKTMEDPVAKSRKYKDLTVMYR
jgi:hypothetical protein